MKPTYQDGDVTLYLGDCLEVLRAFPDCSVDSVVTDPPYGLSFMGKRWDCDVPATEVWAECLRVLKPGGHLLAFAGTRTQHRMCCRIEDAGFEIRDMIAWVYGSGFPKSLDVSKAIDKAAGADREVVGQCMRTGKETGTYGAMAGNNYITAPATDAARQWHGWGTALKPALEPITVARKPLVGTVAENVLAWGTGGLNIDGCRVGTDGGTKGCDAGPSNGILGDGLNGSFGKPVPGLGRWPANLIHDGSEEVLGLTGSAARFFYCAKASKRDRDEGCDELPVRQTVGGGGLGNPVSGAYGSEKSPARNHHPTVKPTDLMRYLCRLVTPPGGTVLDPFMGSGSTGKAAALEGFQFIGIEKEPKYFDIAVARIEAAMKEAKEQLFPAGRE